MAVCVCAQCAAGWIGKQQCEGGAWWFPPYDKHVPLQLTWLSGWYGCL